MLLGCVGVVDIKSLTGAGHFGAGFFIGTMLLVLLLLLKKKSLPVQLYAPFLPFLCGFIAALPYAFLPQDVCNLPTITNIFFGYSTIHCNKLVVTFLGNLHLVAMLCGIIYCVIVLRYILLVKHIRRHGWVV